MAEGDTLASIVEDNAYFKRMLDLLPPQLYFDQETKQQMFAQMANTEEDDIEDKEGIKKKKKKKKNKEPIRKNTNIFRNQLVSQIQENLYTKQDNDFTELKTKPSFETAGQELMPKIIPVASGSADIDDKRARLRAKIEELQAKRKLSAGEKTQRKKLKRQENRMKLKQKKKERKNQGGAEQNKGDNMNKGVNSVVNNRTPGKPIYNKDGQIVYSKFDFTDSAKKEKKGNLKGKDYKRLLDKIEKRNEKINKLKGKDEKAAKGLQDKFKWEAAIQKAEGQKVKDNPDILKKSLKRKEKIKDQKKKKWDNRVESVQKLKDAKQDKRNKHLKERKQAKQENKLKKLKKKGRIIPGF